MKHLFTYTLFFLLYLNLVHAQDAYHTTIENKLANEYGLTNGQWVFFDNEIANLDVDFLFGNTDIIPLTTTSEEFSQITNIYNAVDGNYHYDGGWVMVNETSVQQGDNCLLVINLRRVNAIGKTSILIQAIDNSAFEKLITVTLNNEWTQYLIPFQASKNYAPGELIAGLTLAWEIQEIEVAGLNMLNFGAAYDLDALPTVLHNDRYEGYEANAPWRAPAADRIEQFRKSDLSVLVTDENNEPLCNAEVSIKMLQPDFDWGMEIALNRIAGNVNQNPSFEGKLLNIDGQGHRFEWVTPGNSFKWPGWEENWMTIPSEKVNAAQWLKANDFKVRMHTLVWPGWIPSPLDIEPNANNPQYIYDRVSNWITEINTYPGLEDVFDEYDILNETTTNRDYENTFAGTPGYTTGRELYIDVMNQLAAFVPDKPQVINDYVTISQQQYKGTEYNFLKNTIQEIIDGGAPLDAIGFQCHIDAFPNSLYEIEYTLNDFAGQFGLPLKITEYDVNPDMNDEVAAQYLEDFLTMVYSIPEVEMFIFWGFWDGYHFANNGNFFDINWNEKPAAQAAFGKIFNEWWTEETTLSAQNGIADFRPHKGTYEITIVSNNATIIDTVEIINNSNLTYNLTTTPTNCAAVPIQVWLQGAYNTASNSMTTALQNNGLLPTTQPFNTAPWNYNGNEQITQLPSNAVDWVLVEARSANNSNTIVEQRAAILLSNGFLLDGDGSGVNFQNLAANADYFISIKTRNHLAVMSNTAVNLSSGTTLDFSNPNNILGGITQVANLGNGTYGLFAGDFNSDGVITLNDFNAYTLQLSNTNQYLNGDCNLDQSVTISDFNLYLPNASRIGVGEIRY